MNPKCNNFKFYSIYSWMKSEFKKEMNFLLNNELPLV